MSTILSKSYIFLISCCELPLPAPVEHTRSLIHFTETHELSCSPDTHVTIRKTAIDKTTDQGCCRSQYKICSTD